MLIEKAPDPFKSGMPYGDSPKKLGRELLADELWFLHYQKTAGEAPIQRYSLDRTLHYFVGEEWKDFRIALTQDVAAIGELYAHSKKEVELLRGVADDCESQLPDLAAQIRRVCTEAENRIEEDTVRQSTQKALEEQVFDGLKN